MLQPAGTSKVKKPFSEKMLGSEALGWIRPNHWKGGTYVNDVVQFGCFNFGSCMAISSGDDEKDLIYMLHLVISSSTELKLNLTSHSSAHPL